MVETAELRMADDHGGAAGIYAEFCAVARVDRHELLARS